MSSQEEFSGIACLFMVVNDTSSSDENVNKLDKAIIRGKSKCKRSIKETKRTSKFKCQKRNEHNNSPKTKINLKSSKNIGSSRNVLHNNVKCVYFNARSIVNKQNELELHVRDEDLDIIGRPITETWLNDKISDEELSIKGYTLFRNDRNDNIKTRGGGVALYVRIELNPVCKTDLKELNFPESIWCSINCNGESTLKGMLQSS